VTGETIGRIESTETAETEQLRYVYAVIRPAPSPLPAELVGVADATVRTVRHGDLEAVVSPVPAADFDAAPLRAHLEDLGWLERTARAHERVVDAVASGGCTLPLRLATVYRDDESVRCMLDSGHDRFARALTRLEGRVEWGVKVYTDRPEALPTATASASAASPRARPSGSGRDYLRQRLSARRGQERSWERAAEFSRRLHDELSGRAEDSRLHRPQDARLSSAPGRNILNAAYLIARERAAEFADRVRRLEGAEKAGVRVELTGPWAPYSFAEGDTGDTGGEGRA
jgi:Gas vesicle synthesis protein GvpL/GvpF